jgi:hypothetical protein
MPHTRMTQGAPHEGAARGTMVAAAGEAALLVPTPLDHGTGCASPRNHGTHEPHRILDLLGRIEDQAALGGVHEADGGGRRRAPRRALLRMPPCKRARRTWSSAADLVPLSPRMRRSFKWAGS